MKLSTFCKFLWHYGFLAEFVFLGFLGWLVYEEAYQENWSKATFCLVLMHIALDVFLPRQVAN